jgi:predicted DNA-binding protein (MmcQ/YjbR family)
MKYKWIEDYLMTKNGATRDFKVEWQWHRFLIINKMFAVICVDNEERNIITLKCEPSLGSSLRKQYTSIRPGYYMNKNHWNSVDLDGEMPDEVLREMINQSYQLVLSSLSKSVQKKILMDKDYKH